MINGFVFLVLLGIPAASETDPVEAGRKALGRAGYPWYDSWNDEQRLVLPYDPEPRSSNYDLSGLGTFLQLLMYLLAAVVIGALIYFLVNYFYDPEETRKKTKTKAPGTNADQIEALPTKVRFVDDFLAEAERCAERGDYAEAMVYYYSFQLITLDRFGLIRLMKGKTNRQYVRELGRNRKPLAGELAASVRAFEDVFFGKLPLDRERFLELWNKRDEFLEQAEAPA